MDDNLSLDAAIKERYCNMYSGVFFKRYIVGLWVVAEGIIYDMFDAAKHIVNSVQSAFTGQTYISIDYGTQNATVFLLWKQDKTGKWYCVKEYYYSGRDSYQQKTDAEYADDLYDFCAGETIRAVIVDPSAASFIAELKKHGFKVKKARNEVLDGIRTVGSLLSQNKIAFFDCCIETIKEFANYVWDEKAAQRGED
jgi:PBSX family phage terminase large subunit